MWIKKGELLLYRLKMVHSLELNGVQGQRQIASEKEMIEVPIVITSIALARKSKTVLDSGFTAVDSQ